MISAAARPDQRQATFSVAVLAVFTICLFASAFLLFLVEPMVAKMVLPRRLGDRPASVAVAGAAARPPADDASAGPPDPLAVVPSTWMLAVTSYFTTVPSSFSRPCF